MPNSSPVSPTQPHAPSAGTVQFVRCIAQLGPAERTRIRAASPDERGTDVPTYDIFTTIFRGISDTGDGGFLSQAACHTVFRLYPWNDLPGGEGYSLGHTLGLCAQANPRLRDAIHSRVQRLVEQPESALYPHLLDAVRLLHRAPRARLGPPRARGFPVGWARLIGDLARWSGADNRVQQAWCNDFLHPRQS